MSMWQKKERRIEHVTRKSSHSPINWKLEKCQHLVFWNQWAQIMIHRQFVRITKKLFYHQTFTVWYWFECTFIKFIFFSAMKSSKVTLHKVSSKSKVIKKTLNHQSSSTWFIIALYIRKTIFSFFKRVRRKLKATQFLQ